MNIIKIVCAFLLLNSLALTDATAKKHTLFHQVTIHSQNSNAVQTVGDETPENNIVEEKDQGEDLHVVLAFLVLIFLFSIYSFSRFLVNRKQKNIIKKQKEEVERINQKLVESENKYRGIIENSIDVIYQCDYKGDFIYVNNLVTEFTGYSVEEFLSLNFRDIIVEKHKKMVEDFYVDNWKNSSKIKRYIEFIVKCKDGREIWVGQRVNVVFEDPEKTRIKFFQAISRDITEKKKIEEELEKLSLVASKSTSYVIIADKNDKIEWVNETFTKMTGYTLEESRGKEPGKLLRSEKHAKDIHEKIINTLQKGESYHGEILNYTKEGKEIWFMLNITPIMREGKIHQYIGIGSDITDQKISSDKIKESEKRFRDLFEQTSDIVQSISQEGKFDYVNPAWHSKLGYSKAELANLSFIDIIDPTMVDKCSLLFKGILNNPEKLYETEVDFISKNGEKVNLVGNVIGTQKEEGVSTMAIFHDVTERKKLQDEINHHHEELLHGIEYAKKLQETIMPEQSTLDSFFEDSFVYYNPKEIVSGDFYWFSRVPDTYEEAFFGVVDCTGHGVPGAILSMMGSHFLSNLVTISKMDSPDMVLNALNKNLKQVFSMRNRVMQDGMDISLCMYNRETKKLKFSGAVHNLYLVRDNEVVEYKGDYWTIGQKDSPYTLHEIDVLKGDKIYMVSDGFTDQFGGDEGKKFTKMKLKKILLENKDMAISKQKNIFINYHEEWKKDVEQTDDITLFGIEI